MPITEKNNFWEIFPILCYAFNGMSLQTNQFVNIILIPVYWQDEIGNQKIVTVSLPLYYDFSVT